MRAEITINGRKIGQGHPTYIIAEMSGNHNQSYEKATEIVRAAKEAGADAIKLQTYTADTITIDTDNQYFRIKEENTWGGQTLYELYQKAYTPWEWQPMLKEEAEKIGLTLFSTPFDTTAVDFLDSMNVPAYKIASFEITDIPLIKYIAKRNKPIIISTGMATLEEIKEAVREAGCRELALLKCTSAYPAPAEDINLKTIPHLAQTFGVPIGLSDHTLGITAPVAAVALGASIVEKHFTLSRLTPGPDSAFSLEPEEFHNMVTAIRETEKALGGVHYEPTARESENRNFRRSLFIVKDVKAGDLVTPDNVRSIRPGNGLHPKHLEEVMGCIFTKDASKGTPLKWDLI